MEYLKSALSNIKQNKGRSFLTMLGIIIGIASVITILAIGDGMKSYVNQSLDDIASGSVTIEVDQKKTDRFLTNENLMLIEDAVSEVLGVSPFISDYVDAYERYTATVRIVGGMPAVEREESNGMYKGRFFTEDDVDSASYVAVMPQAAAILIFGTDDALGKTFSFDANSKSGEVTVIGILKSKEAEIAQAESFLRNSNDNYYSISSVYVPYTLLTQRFGYAGEKITSFRVYVQPGMADETALKVKSVTENILDLRGEAAVKIQSFASIAGAYNNILGVVTMVVAVIAAISLLVGGIGVMNIMTVTVTERTREIGIRKSLGARTQYILLQFLTESALITLIGGFIGIVMGGLFTFVVSRFMSFPPIISPVNVLIVVTISVADGLFFGIYPARKAAALNPIDALRQE